MRGRGAGRKRRQWQRRCRRGPSTAAQHSAAACSRGGGAACCYGGRTPAGHCRQVAGGRAVQHDAISTATQRGAGMNSRAYAHSPFLSLSSYMYVYIPRFSLSFLILYSSLSHLHTLTHSLLSLLLPSMLPGCSCCREPPLQQLAAAAPQHWHHRRLRSCRLQSLQHCHRQMLCAPSRQEA